MKKLIALMLAAMLVVSVFAGCGGAKSADPNVLKFGLTGPLTGSASAYGLAVRAGMEIAVEEINANPSNTLKIEFKAEDDEADGADKAVGAYNALMDWGMQVMAGPVTTGSSLVIADKCVDDQVFMLTPSASAVDVALTGPNVYQMCFTDPNQGASAAELIAQKWPDATIGVIYDSSDAYSAGIRDGFLAKAKELGLNVAVSDAAFDTNNKSDMGPYVEKCIEAQCDLVFLPFYYTEASAVLRYADGKGYKPTFFGCDGMDGILTVEGFDAALAEGLVLMTPFDANATDAATTAFVAKYTEKMDGLIPNQFAADGYDVIYTLYNACVAAGIDGTTSRADANAKLQAQFKGLTVDGLTGKGMTWDADGMISKAPAAVVITDGIYVPMA